MPENREQLRKKLQNKLRELFQFNVSDLDFGIYRILNRKKNEIEQFIEEELLKAIDKGLEEYKKGDRDKFEAQLEDAKNKIPDNAFDDEGNIKKDFEGFEDVERYKEAENALEGLNVSEEIEKRIYNDLYTFFSRYYDEGDFVTQRRISTRDSKYAIPYNGEEVKLHWANKDQYYIKTGEHFTDYKFEADELDIWFKLQQAETEKDNVKESETRYFILRPDDPIEIDEDENRLTLWFEYRPLNDDEEDHWLKVYNRVEKKRKTLDRQALCIAFDEWVRSELSGKWRDALSKIPANKERSLLYTKLNHYTGKNTADYFIHKNLQDFLERELEYYLKQEVIQVDDFIQGDSQQPMQAALIRAKVVRGIAQKVITFLSQIENFQKKLFEKKKFVVDTHYCFTLDKVPEELYETILKNEEQLSHWKTLYAVDEWENTLEWNGKWTEAALQHHPFMMIDTRFFDEDFKYGLLASFDDLDEELGGILINGENYQGLSELQNKYHKRIKCIYIDPPYNTAATEILYKNNYKHSSWLSLLFSRLKLGKALLTEDAIHCITIDDFEFPMLSSLLSEVFRRQNELAVVPVRSNPHGRAMAAGFSTNHEYAIFYANSETSEVGRLPRSEKKRERYPEEDENGIFCWINFRGTGANTRRIDRPKLYYPVYVSDEKVRIPDMKWSENKGEWLTLNKPNENESILYPIDSNNSERVWSLGWERAQEEEDINLSVRKNSNGLEIYRKYHPNQEGALPGTWWHDAKYSATESGTKVIKELFGERDNFSYPKSISLVEDSLRASSCDKSSYVLDYFAGSGTTGHAVLNLNKEDNGNRKYILVEMGKYFNTVLKPRLQKVVFSDNWKDGVPQDKNGQSHAFKYHFIESYEDALNNIDFKKKDDTQEALKFDDYILKYMLDFETQGVSATLLKGEAFKTPFDYKLNIQHGHETPKEEKVDLVETFHYLIGLWLKTVRRHEHQARKYVISKGEIRNEDAIEEVLVIWRNTEGLELDKEAKWIKEELIGDQTFDRIYINGASKVKNAQPTEITIREKMFEEVNA